MNATGWANALFLTLCLSATAAGAQTVSVGALRGPVPSDATIGALRGSISTDTTTVGAQAGPLPVGATIGARQGSVPAGATTGTFASPGAAITGALQGSIPPGATTGGFAGALPSNATFRMPTPEDVARTQESLARMHLTDRSYRDAELLLRRSLSIREEALGPQSPEVAEAMESDARLLHRYNRTDAAVEFEDRARAIRERLKSPTQAE